MTLLDAVDTHIPGTAEPIGLLDLYALRVPELGFDCAIDNHDRYGASGG